MTANMLNKKLKTNESGRSMVEMLGVLAVIGVLSIGGIAGYTTAMNNYHANETVNQARLLATMVSTQRLLNANGGDLSNDDLKGKFTFDSATTDSIKLTATGLDSKVKDRITAMDLKIAKVDVDNSGNVTFTFKNDLSEVGDATTPSIDYNEWEKGSCEDGYIKVDGYISGCARTPEEVEPACVASDEYNDGYHISIDVDSVSGKKFFNCAM